MHQRTPRVLQTAGQTGLGVQVRVHGTWNPAWENCRSVDRERGERPLFQSAVRNQARPFVGQREFVQRNVDKKPCCIKGSH